MTSLYPKVLFLGAALTLAVPMRCEASAELMDVAARIHFGFYQHEPRAIASAQASLDRLGETDDVRYYRDFAALRQAQLGSMDRDALQRLAQCAERGAGRLRGRLATEVWLLAAACAWVGDDERRLASALAAARRHDADHPRLLLIEAWMLERAVASGEAPRETLAPKWTEVLAAFDAFEAALDDPGWGHAEALAALAACALESGEARTARDLIERALMLAPDYRVAVDLHGRLQGKR